MPEPAFPPGLELLWNRRERLRNWATVQREMLDRHAWITEMPLAAPPLGPNSMHFVEKGSRRWRIPGSPIQTSCGSSG